MNKLRLFIFCFLFICIVLPSQGQTQAQIDSIEHLLKIEQDPSKQGYFLILLASVYRHNNIQKAIDYAHRAVDFRRTIFHFC